MDLTNEQYETLALCLMGEVDYRGSRSAFDEAALDVMESIGGLESLTEIGAQAILDKIWSTYIGLLDKYDVQVIFSRHDYI